MADFEDLYNGLLNSLEQEEEFNCDDIRDTIRDPNFVVLLKAIYEIQEASEKTEIYSKCIAEGFRLYDLQKALRLLTGDFDEDVFLAPLDFPIVQDEEGENVFQEEPIEAEQNEEETQYYFSCEFRTECSVKGEGRNVFQVKSNLFSVLSIVSEAVKVAGCIITESHELKIDQSQDAFEEKNLYKTAIDEAHVVEEHREQVFSLSCNDDTEKLGAFYYFFRAFAIDIFHRVEYENTLLKLRSFIKSLDDLFKRIVVEKVVYNDNTLNRCKALGIVTLADLLTIKLNGITNRELDEVVCEVQSINRTVPQDILKEWIRHLKAKEYYVIKTRYLQGEMQILEEIGTKCNVSRERIRQIEKKAINMMLSPKRNKYRIALIDQLKLLSPHRSYITISELEEIGLGENVASFLDKITGDIIYDCDFKACFFSRTSKNKLEKCLEELPDEFTKNDLQEYCTLIADETKGAFTEDEIYKIITAKYRFYGEYITKSKITIKVVLSVLMQKYFPNGTDLYNEENIQKLREKATEEFDGFELAENSRAIRARLQSICILVGRGIWKYDTEQKLISDEFGDEIMEYISDYRSPVVPIQAVLNRFTDKFNEMGISNKYSLHGQLKKVLPPQISINRDYVFKNSNVSFYEIVEAFIKQSALPVTKRDIQETFPGITDIVIQQVAATTRVMNMNGYYVHLDNLNISDNEANELKEAVDGELNDDIIYHANTIFARIKERLSGLFNRIGVTHYLQFYYLLHEIYPTNYAYNRPFIARVGVELVSGEAQVINRILQEEECNIAIIREYAKEVGTVIDRYIEFVDRNNDSFVFKNRDSVIATSALGLEEADFSGLDEVLSDFMGEKQYRLLSDFYNFRELPDLTCNWNTWLLYSIVRKYSRKFKLVLTSNVLADAKPILVLNDFDISRIDLGALADLDAGDAEQMDETEEELLDEFDYGDLE